MSHTPVVKFEPSPADSLVDSFSSNPNTQYSSLFSENQVLTPQSFDDDSMFGDDMVPSSPAQEETKPVKKRKSWGQQLPEPKTNLPPRYARNNSPSSFNITNHGATGNEQRPKMRKNNAESNASYATDEQHNHRGKENVKR